MGQNSSDPFSPLTRFRPPRTARPQRGSMRQIVLARFPNFAPFYPPAITPDPFFSPVLIDPIALERRNALIGKIMAQYDDDAGDVVLPVVQLDDFFEGNWDENALAPNMVGYGRPALQECYRILREIRGQPEVQDVLVAIHETPYADEPLDFDIWPDSDTVYVLSSASRDQIATWASALKPDDIGDNWSCNTGKKPNAAPDLRPDMKVYALWWD